MKKQKEEAAVLGDEKAAAALGDKKAAAALRDEEAAAALDDENTAAALSNEKAAALLDDDGVSKRRSPLWQRNGLKEQSSFWRCRDASHKSSGLLVEWRCLSKKQESPWRMEGEFCSLHERVNSHLQH